MLNLEPDEKMDIAVNFESRMVALLEEYYQVTGRRVEDVAVTWYTYSTMPPTPRRDTVAGMSLRTVVVRG